MNDGLYRGFVQCNNNKTPVQPYKDGEPLLTLEEAQQYDAYAGVLNDNVVMVDIDNSDHAERMKRIVDAYQIRCRITKTRRGMHFTFFCIDSLMNHSHIETAIGLIADYKYGVNRCCEVLKEKGKEREVLLDPDQIQTIPRWLYPKSDKVTTNDPSFSSIVGMSEGGRDETLFKWNTANCRRSTNSANKTPFNVMANISHKDYCQMITIINQFIFDDPLPEEEVAKFLDRKTFEEKAGFAKENEKKAKKGGEYRDLVMDLIEKAKVRQFGKALYRIQDGKYYKLLSDVFINHELIAKRKMEPEKQKAAQTMIRAYQDDASVPCESYCVGFKNGVMNWRTGKFVRYEDATDAAIFRYFDVAFNPLADTAFVDGVISDWCQGDTTKKAMLYELAGCCFYSDKPIKKWWAIEGKADTGKSTFLRLLRDVIGEENVGSTPIQNLKDSNAIAELIDKPVNIVDDGSSKFTTDLSNLRRIIQGDEMQVKLLYQNRFTVRIESRMVFVFNKIPRFRDDNDATAKKMLVIDFNRVYSDDEKDTDLINKLTTEENKEAFVLLATNAMNGVLLRNLTFTASEESKRIISQIIEESDQFVSFVADTISEDYDWKKFLDGKKTSDVYEDFRKWADAEGYQSPLIRKQFTERCCKESGAKVRKSHGDRFYTFD